MEIVFSNLQNRKIYKIPISFYLEVSYLPYQDLKMFQFYLLRFVRLITRTINKAVVVSTKIWKFRPYKVKFSPCLKTSLT